MKVFIFNSEYQVYATLAHSLEEAKEKVIKKFEENAEIFIDKENQIESVVLARKQSIEYDREELYKGLKIDPVILDESNPTEIYSHSNE